MTKNKISQNDYSAPSTGAMQTIRQKAEERLKKQSPAQGGETSKETGRLLHELQVHQIELEMQNEELRRAQVELEASRTKYFDLYDLAPVGYLTLSEQGLILEANLTVAQMLDMDRSLLAGQPMTRFIFREDQDIYYFSRKQLIERQTPLTFELRIVGNDGKPFWVQIQTKVARDSNGALVWRATLSDIAERKRTEQALQEGKMELQQLSDTLELQVWEKTAELAKTNEDLRHLSGKLISTQEAERKRIAGEIHDNFGSSLSAIKFKVEDAIQKLGKIPPASSKILESIIPLIKENIEECRRIQMDLRPPLLDDLGLLPTLSWFFKRFQTVYPTFTIKREIDLAEEDVPLPLKIVAFRVTQEAMNNIAKHSQAGLVLLSLRKLDDRIELVIQDNGRGFNLEEIRSAPKPQKGLGLTSMKERVELSGGLFAVESREGKGTVIRAVWPV